MEDDKVCIPKIVLLLEDEPEITVTIQRLFEPYGDRIRLETTTTAKQAFSCLYPDKKGQPAVHALILDIMLPYGSKETRNMLKGEGDLSELDPGIRLLEYVRKKEAKDKAAPIWVSVITGRNAPHVLKLVRDLLKGKGRLQVKPFNDKVLENDIALMLGIPSKVPEFLLPEGYEPPSPAEVGHGI